jgi:hypothetical protein
MNPPESPEKAPRLRDDIRLLGRILGDTVRQQEGEAVPLPAWRATCRAHWLGPPGPLMQSSAASIALMSNFPQSGIGPGSRPEATHARNVASSSSSSIAHRIILHGDPALALGIDQKLIARHLSGSGKSIANLSNQTPAS